MHTSTRSTNAFSTSTGTSCFSFAMSPSVQTRFVVGLVEDLGDLVAVHVVVLFGLHEHHLGSLHVVGPVQYETLNQFDDFAVEVGHVAVRNPHRVGFLRRHHAPHRHAVFGHRSSHRLCSHAISFAAACRAISVLPHAR